MIQRLTAGLGSKIKIGCHPFMQWDHRSSGSCQRTGKQAAYEALAWRNSVTARVTRLHSVRSSRFRF